MYEKTLAEMSSEKKNSLSHRKKALDQLIKSIIFKKTFIL
jgi:inosine/xanthosine triphosphate pyrophosphatase family protein